MSFALPDALRSYIDERVRSGEYGNTSEYLRELIRRDQRRWRHAGSRIDRRWVGFGRGTTGDR